jgi:hypothetical protein
MTQITRMGKRQEGLTTAKNADPPSFDFGAARERKEGILFAVFVIFAMDGFLDFKQLRNVYSPGLSIS